MKSFSQSLIFWKVSFLRVLLLKAFATQQAFMRASLPMKESLSQPRRGSASRSDLHEKETTPKKNNQKKKREKKERKNYFSESNYPYINRTILFKSRFLKNIRLPFYLLNVFSGTDSAVINLLQDYLDLVKRSTVTVSLSVI